MYVLVYGVYERFLGNIFVNSVFLRFFERDFVVVIYSLGRYFFWVSIFL